MTTINRATWVDDDGSGTTGTIINNARLQADIYDKIDQGFATLDTKNASQDTSITANGPHKILSANHTDVVPATLVTGDLLGTDATGKLARLPVGTNGQILTVVSGLSAWAAAPVSGVPPWTAVPFNAAHFTASGSMTWRVEAADILFYRYVIFGSVGIVAFDIYNTTIGGAAGTQLKIALPAGFVPAQNMVQPGVWVTNAGAAGVFGVANVTTTQILLFCDATMAKLWTLGTNNTRVAAILFLELAGAMTRPGEAPPPTGEPTQRSPRPAPRA